jgi:hypothetical protein
MAALATDRRRVAARRLAARAHEVITVPEPALGGEGVLGWRRRRTLRIDPQRRPYSGWFDGPSLLGVRGSPGWRMRAAYLTDEEVFAVDYTTCGPCRIGWVEEPYTVANLERCGLASAGLAGIRADHPGLAWHTAGGHLRDARLFWDTVGGDVPGRYRPREG